MPESTQPMRGVTYVAKECGVSRVTVYKWCRTGKVKAIELPNGQIRIPDAEVRRILKNPAATHMKKPARNA